MYGKVSPEKYDKQGLTKRDETQNTENQILLESSITIPVLPPNKRNNVEPLKKIMT